MAKPLQKAPPTSAVVGLFDREAASRATAVLTGATQVPPETFPREETFRTPSLPASVPPRVESVSPVHGEPANVVREFVLSRSSEEAFDRLLDLFRRRTGTRLTGSHLARAMLKGVAYAMESIEHESKHLGPLKLPSNAKGREAEREAFEDQLAQVFVNGIRSAASYGHRPR